MSRSHETRNALGSAARKILAFAHFWLAAQVAGFEPTIDGFGVRPHSPICCTYFNSSGTSKVSIPKRHAFNDAFYNAGKRPTSIGSLTTCPGREKIRPTLGFPVRGRT